MEKPDSGAPGPKSGGTLPPIDPRPANSNRRPALPLSIDWEDWFQLCCDPFDRPEALEQFEDRLELATERTLDLCEELGARATWFCLADQSRRHPELLRRIAGAGHEIALHGWTHHRATDLDPEEFRLSLLKGKALLEDLAGVSVAGFRAPEWSLRGRAESYWGMLPELGFHFDSSRAPLNILGDPAWRREAHRLEGGLWELPPPVAGAGALTVPLWGWAIRLLPAAWLRQRILELAQAGAGNPLVLHPWELDPAQPTLPSGTPFGHRFAHGAGLRGLDNRLRELWAGLRLVPMGQWVASQETGSGQEVQRLGRA